MVDSKMIPTTKVMDISNIRRVGIFAITDIEIGDELQYSYNKGKNDLLLEKEGTLPR